MYLELFSVVVAVLGCLAGAVSDIRSGKVPNRLTGSMFALSLVLFFIRFFSGESGLPLIYAVNFFGGFLIGFVFWYMRAWSGGDAKMFWALCALMPAYPLPLAGLYLGALPPYSGWFFCLSVLLDLALLLLLRFYIEAACKFFKEKRLKDLLGLSARPFLYLASSFLFASALAHLAGIPSLSYASLPLVLLLSLVERRSFKLFFSACVILSALGIGLLDLHEPASLAKLLPGQKTPAALAFLLSAYAVGSRVPLSRLIEIDDLRPGMALAEEIRFSDGKIVRRDADTSLWGFVTRELLARWDGNYVARPSPAGLSGEDIANLKKNDEGLYGLVKVGRSFKLMPYMFAALLASFFADFFRLIFG